MKLKDNLYRIVNVNVNVNVKEFQIELLPDCIIYQAHFPGQPITPGVCVSQIAVELASEVRGESLELREIKNCKFLSVMTPDKPNVVYCLECEESKEGAFASGQNAEIVIKAIAKSEDTIYAKMSLICLKR